MEIMDTLFRVIRLNNLLIKEGVIMFQVLHIQKSQMTKFITLLNLETGTKERVFDDSSVVSFHDFEFMKEGEIYDCKIELFGEFKKESGEEITIVERGILVGKRKYLKVQLNSDIYYVLEPDLPLSEKMYYVYTRKDLIQVDNAIHADCF